MSAITLTPKGKQQAEETWGSGPKYTILAYLYGLNAPAEVEEVIDHLKTDPVKVQAVLRSMLNDDLIEEL
jgi:DNA-binding MarR family transcriptional regulator